MIDTLIDYPPIPRTSDPLVDINEPAIPPLTLENMRNFDRGTLIRQLVSKLDQHLPPDQRKASLSIQNSNHKSPSPPTPQESSHPQFWRPTLEQVKTLICIRYRDDATFLETFAESSTAIDQIPWPVSSTPKNFVTISDKHIVESYQPIAEASFGKIHDFDDFNGLSDCLPHVVIRLSHSDRVDLASYLLSNWEIFTSCSDDDDPSQKLLKLCFVGIAADSPAAVPIGQHLIDFISTHINESDLSASPERSWGEDDNKWWFLFDLFPERRQFIYRALASGSFTSDDRHKIMGILIRSNYNVIPTEINLLRDLIMLPDIPAEELNALTHMVRETLGLLHNLDNSPEVFTTLEALYDSIDFSKYPVSEATRGHRKDFFLSLLPGLGITQDQPILDLGSGTGWMTADLADLGYNVFGRDVSAKNITLAKNSFPNHKERFQLGDWYHIPGKYSLIASLGRSLPHTETQGNFNNVLDSVSLALEPGGYFVFDMPNPEVGSYKENIANYRNTLLNFGLTPKEIDQIWYVVDSPDGKSFYNRFTPPRNLIEQMLNSKGFTIKEVIYEDLPNGKSDQNLVFVAQKLPPQSSVSQPIQPRQDYRYYHPSNHT